LVEQAGRSSAPERTPHSPTDPQAAGTPAQGTRSGWCPSLFPVLLYAPITAAAVLLLYLNSESRFLGRQWDKNEQITLILVGAANCFACLCFLALAIHKCWRKSNSTNSQDAKPATTDQLTDIQKLDITKLHLEVNQLRYFELLCCSFAIALVSATAPAFAKSTSVGVAVVVGVCVLTYWHTVIMNVRSRLTTYMRTKGWSEWENDYRQFAKENSEMSGSQKGSMSLIFLVLALAPLMVFVLDHSPRYFLDGERPSNLSSWAVFWCLIVASVFGSAIVIASEFTKDVGVLDRFLVRWNETLHRKEQNGPADNSAK
jgi:hypothetical protein